MKTLLEKFDFLASYPKTCSLHFGNTFIKCTYRTKIEEDKLVADFSDCKRLKVDFKLNNTKGKEIFLDYMKEFEENPKEYMINQLDNIIFKEGDNEYCFINGDKTNTDKSRSCIIDLTTRKNLFSK